MSLSRRTHGLCSPECSYRRLYEGSQASLSDMAGKQAGALNRVARLRDGVVRALKQVYPVQFAAAEQQMGSRMSGTEDEVLLAYLSGFLTSSQQGTAAGSVTPDAAGSLRAALLAQGYDLPDGSDLHAWAAAVRARPATTLSSTPPADAGDASTGPATAPVAPEAPEAPESPVGDGGRRRTGTAALAASPSGAPAGGRRKARRRADAQSPAGASTAELPDASTVEPDWDDAAFADLASLDPNDVPPIPEDDAVASGDLSSLFDEREQGSPQAPTAGLEDLFSDATSDRVFEDLNELEDPQALVEALFAEAEDTPVPAGPNPAAPTAPTARTGLQAALQAAPGSSVSQVETEGSAAAAVSRDPEPLPERTQELKPEPTPEPRPRPETAAAAAGDVVVDDRSARGAMRPQLFPTAAVPKAARSARRGRSARVTAAPPDPRGLDVPLAEPGIGAPMTDELFDKLVAAVVIPRPVFTSDLVAMVGAESFAAWEQRCRDMSTDCPVRFITPKPRHRARGSLIVPHAPDLRAAASEFTKSSWAACLDDRRLRGAKLYEVAVLLHRFGDSVLSNRVEDNLVVLRVTQPRGLIGVVMTLEGDLASGSDGRAALAEGVEQLLADRLTLIAALTYQGEKNAVNKLADALREESTARAWTPTAPVIASTSWDFASDGGSSALSVL